MNGQIRDNQLNTFSSSTFGIDLNSLIKRRERHVKRQTVQQTAKDPPSYQYLIAMDRRPTYREG